jgi:hypothetical protein
MYPYPPPPIFRLRLSAPGGEAPRSHAKAAHPPSVVAQARHLVETTPHTFRTIATRTGVNSGTIARWAEKHGWTRPAGAFPMNRRPERRHVPALIGRVLAQRLRVQAERLVRAIEEAPEVDPAALAEALALVERARAEQHVRRGKRLRPPDPPPADAPVPEARPALDAATRARLTETRRKAAYKAWATRWANQAKPPTWSRAGGAGERVLAARALRERQERRREREFDKSLPSPHLNPTKPAYSSCLWDRSAAARAGWKRRKARLAGKEA